MNCAHNSSISIHKYLQEKGWNSIDTKPSHLPASPPGGEALGRAGWCRLLCPPATPQLLANAEGLGLPHTRAGQRQPWKLWKHLSPAHTSLTQTQQPMRQVQAALTLQPCKLKHRGKSRQRLKWDYLLMCATTTTHHNYTRGNYKKLSITEDEALSFSRWAVSTRKL